MRTEYCSETEYIGDTDRRGGHTAAGRVHRQFTEIGLRKEILIITTTIKIMKSSKILMASMLISMMMLQVLGAPQNKPVKKLDATGNPGELSYEELRFIDQKRRGGFPVPPKRLSPCAKAILGCCEENAMNSECSEALHCGAHFFDDNPCDDKFIIDALNAARLYYDQFNNVNT